VLGVLDAEHPGRVAGVFHPPQVLRLSTAESTTDGRLDQLNRQLGLFGEVFELRDGRTT
jgi:hypothetical protein